jgi:hypothetical protein
MQALSKAISRKQFRFDHSTQQALHRRIQEKIKIASLTNDAIVAEFAAALTLFSIYQ